MAPRDIRDPHQPENEDDQRDPPGDDRTPKEDPPDSDVPERREPPEEQT